MGSFSWSIPDTGKDEIRSIYRKPVETFQAYLYSFSSVNRMGVFQGGQSVVCFRIYSTHVYSGAGTITLLSLRVPDG